MGGSSSDSSGVIYRIDTTLNNAFTAVHQLTNTTGCQPISLVNLISGHQFDVVYEFSDVTNPNSLLLNKNNRLLYGAASVDSSTYYGSTFTIDIRHEKPSTTFKELFSFNYRTGTFPSNLILFNSSLYVNTEMLGQYGDGTSVKMDLDGTNTKLIHAFGHNDELGCGPWSQLVLVTDKQQQQ